MKFKIDENLPQEVCQSLISSGHDAMTVWAEGLTGASDSQLANVCRAEERILVTLDLDFVELARTSTAMTNGVVVFRLAMQDKKRILRATDRLLALLADDTPTHQIWIIEETVARFRAITSV